jgi:tRNA threonylcarbamoyl adenosine modification protein YeaZ
MKAPGRGGDGRGSIEGDGRLLLSIEASTGYGSVAVGTEGVVLAEVGVSARERLSAKLVPMANEALRLAGARREELGGVVVGAGPGSFTGIRVAAATAKGIARALRIPLSAYSSLLATASNAWAFGGEVCALADARGRDVFAARYRFGGSIETLDTPEALTIDEVIERWAVTAPLFLGSGAVRHREELERAAGVTVADEGWAVPRASSLLWLAARIPETGRIADPARWQPDYARASGAERIAAARETRANERDI